MAENESDEITPKKSKEEWIEYYIEQFEKKNLKKPDLEETDKIVSLAIKSVDSSGEFTKDSFVMILTIAILIAVSVYIVKTDAEALDKLNIVPPGLWNILTIVIGFWFGGNVGSVLIEKWKSK